MKIELKELFCIEWEFNRKIILDSDTAYTVTVFFGPKDSKISEAFYVTICNLDYVKKKEKQNGFFNGLWHLVTENPEEESLEKYFQSQICLLSGETWEDYYQKLRLVGRSEFEDYHGRTQGS
jgi:catechol 2,3-dioxygenase-like lactoylglutathione lyase family enzyme